MARKIHIFDKTTEELDVILNKAENKPFIRWHDEAAGVYRFFPDEEKATIWIDAYLNDSMTPEIAAYEFTEPITAPAPYTVNITVINDNRYILEGTEGTTLDFTFETRDGNQGLVQESVDVYYTFRSPAGSKTTAAVYNAGTQVHMNIDNFLSLGINTIAIMVRGRATGASKTIIATYTVIKLKLNSTFQIARSIEPNTPFDVTYTVEGDADKVVEFYIDGQLSSNSTISSLEPIATKVQRLNGLTSGKHTLQMVAKMQIGSYLFKSKLLYYEFIVKGVELTTTVIAEQFPYTQDVFSGSTPGLNGEQYVIKTINWAYYSSDYDKLNAVIQWRLYTEAGDETPLATRNADVVEAETDVPPEPLQFMPTESGSYHLQALINGVVIGDYTIAVIANTAGILEPTAGLTMKLSGLGRDNAEPSETLTSWADRGFSTQFFNQPWNGNSGWNGSALVLNNGATAKINNKPFAIEISPTIRNGAVFEIDFETFNVSDNTAEVLRIGNLGTASLVITGDKAVLTSKDGRSIISRFKTDERIKIAFVIYPNTSTDYKQKVFVYNNGVMSGVMEYPLSDNFNIGSLEATESDIGMINLGNANSKASIKIYYIRTYSNIINMYEELNNYFIDSGENIQYLVNDNDIYAPGTRIIDVDKLQGTITTVKLTGSLNEIIGEGSKDSKISCALEVTSPDNSNINLYCDKAEVNKAGQSTLDKPVPSFHVKLDKNGNICYNRDGKPYSKNRWAFREGNVPEKKFRLQANYMDSSCCHNAAFFRLFNQVSKQVSITQDGATIMPLRIPAEVYADKQYPNAMQAIHGDDPSGNNWKFPYTINVVPDSIPCVVIWRPDENSAYRFLGQYVIMEEKKANYANGMHSIYSGLDGDGKADPFGFRSSKTGTKLWDNADCHQMEFLRSSENLELFLSEDTWASRKRDSFELIYPDEDDLTESEIDDEWQKFYDDIVHPIVSSKNDQEAFDDLLYGENPKLDRWSFAAYYCLVLRNACSDSLVRNMELVTYDGNIWGPKWWDVDMQCGLQQSGACDIEPTTTRDTKLSGDAYALSGRLIVDGVLRSSWLWDGLEASTQFMQDVEVMDKALYQAGWRYAQITNIQDNEYVNAWSNALYNESGIVKYLTYDELNYKSLQGDRTPHRHWFLRTSYDYFDALHVCGEYTDNRFEARTQSIAYPKQIRFKAAYTHYFGWEHTNDIVESGIKVEKGDYGVLTIDRTLNYNDPLHILGANKIEELDLSEIFHNLYADIKVEKMTDSVLGSQLKKLILGSGDGSTKTKLNTGLFNNYEQANVIGGASTLTRLEYLDIQGMHTMTGIDMSAMKSLSKFYAAGSSLISFNPASGSDLTEVELPTTIRSMEMDGCNLTDANNHCVIKWYETTYEDNLPTGVVESTIPADLRVLLFSGMGTDKGTQELIISWLNAVYDEYGNEGLSQLQLTCRNINWEGVLVSDLLKLSKIPSTARQVTGRIKCYGTLTGADIVAIQAAFGPYVFTNNPGVPLRIDADAGFILGAPEEILAGNTVQVTGVAFPIEGSTTAVTYRLGYNDGGTVHWQTAQTNLSGRRYYIYKSTTLWEDDGTIETTETSEPDYDIVVEGASAYASDYATITVKKRTYPTSVNYDVAATPGKRVSYDSVNNAYYVTDDEVVLTLNAYTTPEQVTGTIATETWTISNEIASLCVIREQTNNLLTLYIATAGATMSTGTITHTKTYVDGTIKSRTITFRFKTPVAAVTQSCNPELQTSLYNQGYADSSVVTMDYEVWQIRDLSFALGSGNTLLHIAELNDFLNLDMTDLDLSNCTNLGNNKNQVRLEDGTDDYINYFPRKSQTLAFDFETIDLSNTHLAGINLKQGSTLESITYGDYTEEVVLVNQSALTEVNIPEDAITTMDKLVIENCNELEEITWI